MEKILFILLFASLSASAQKTKSFDVCKTQLAHITGSVRYDLHGEKTDTSYFFLGRDSRYTQHIGYVAIRMSSLLDIYYLLKECRDLIKTEEVGVSDYRGDNQISIGKYAGMKYVNIYEPKDIGSGYTQFLRSQITNVLTGIEYFAKTHKIALE
jgi:hypothetical protein